MTFVHTEAWEYYKKIYSKDAICGIDIKEIPSKFENESGNSEEAITQSMIQILRHGNPIASYMCDYRMPINNLVRLVGMGGLQATTKKVLTLGLHTKAHGRSSGIFQLMMVAAEEKNKEI